MANIWQSSEIWLLMGSLLLLAVGLFVFVTNGLNPLPSSTKQSPTAYSTPMAATWTPTSAFDELTALPIIWRKPLEYEDPPPIEPTLRQQIIEVERPSCYGLADGSYSCIGRFWNRGVAPIGDTGFDFAFYDQTGQATTRESVTVEQRVTLSGQFAPYRAILQHDFAVLEAASERTSVEISHNFSPNSALRALHIVQAEAQIAENGQYQLSMTLENDTGHPVENIRVMTTLASDKWGVVGYEVHEVGDILQNNTSMSLEVEIIPYTLSETVSHTIHAEALITN